MTRIHIAAACAGFAALAACRGGAAPQPLASANREIKTVAISHGRESFSLTQDSPGVWRVLPPDDAVDPADAAALLDGLRGLRPQTRLSKDAAAYGLSALDATNVHAEDFAGRPLFASRFGRPGLGGTVHMAAAAGGEVYLGSGPSPELLARNAQDWRDRRLLGAPCANVTIDSGRGWRAASPETASMLCGLRATAILPSLPAFLAGLDRPVLRVRAASGAFAVGSLMGGERWITVEGRAALLRAPAAPLAAALVESRVSRAPPKRGIITK
jgi:hypothetical protein